MTSVTHDERIVGYGQRTFLSFRLEGSHVSVAKFYEAF